MTTEQQNILTLFNTKDPVNMEIAEETAISTGNGVWFSNWIGDKIKAVKFIMRDFLYLNSSCLKKNLDMLQIILKGVYIELFTYQCIDIYTDTFIINNNQTTIYSFETDYYFDYSHLKGDLEELGIKVTII